MAKISEIADIPALEKQRDQVVNMLRIIRNEAATTAAEMSTGLAGVKSAKSANEITSIIEKQNKQVEALNKKYQELTNTEGQLYEYTVALAKAKAQVKFETDKINKAEQQEVKEANGLVSAYDKLNQQYKEAAAKAKNLGIEFGRNSVQYKEARAEANKYGSQLKQIDADMGQHQRNVGNYSSAFKNLGSQLLAVTGITVGIAGALKVFNGIIESTDKLSDQFSVRMEGIRQSMSFLARSIANLDFTNLVQGFKNAYQEGKRYAEQLDLIGNLQRSAGLQKEDIEIEITKLKTLAKLNTTSIEERKKYIDQIAILERRKLDISSQVAQTEVDNELTNAEKITGVRRDVIENFVAYYGTYAKLIEEGRKIEEKVRKESPAMVTTLDSRGRAVQQLGFSQEKYNENVKKLNANDRARLDLLKLENVLTDEKRKKIAESLSSQKQAYKEQADGENSLTKIKNKLSKELVAEDVNFRKTTQSIEEQRKKMRDLALTLEYIEPKEYVTKDQTKQIEEAKKEIEDLFGLPLLKEKDFWQKRIKIPVDEISEWEDFFKEIQSLAIETLGTGISDQISASFENSINEMNAQLEQWHDREIDNLDKRKQQGLITEQQYQAGRDSIEKQYEAKRKAARIKEAQIKKQEALWEIAINTAVRAAAVTPLTPQFYLILANGAAQAALVAAQPIPKYAKGRHGGKGEFAIVGEQGSEAIRLTSGKTFITPDTATMTYLPSGADVISNRELKQSLTFKQQSDDYRQYTREVVNAINGKKEVYVNIDSNGLRTFVRNGNRLQKYLDRNVIL